MKGIKKGSGRGDSVAASMIWKTLERYSALGISLIVQIVIARILEPEEFGIISMMTVFISVATVFIQNGFNMALIQMKDADEDDYSTALWINTMIGLILYGIIFVSAPYIAAYYEQPAITDSLRILALILIIGSAESIQLAIASRKMQFKKIFISNLLSSVTSGAVGIVLALLGFGVWALVFQQLSYKIAVLVIMGATLHWRPRFVIKKESAGKMLSYGWKLLFAGLVNSLYNELNSLVIGKKYSESDLAYYSKGKQFPTYIATGIDSSIQSVMFSAFSKKQTDRDALHGMLIKSIAVNIYVIFPLMLGLALVAEPFIAILLTEKWLLVVPYMQVCCITYAVHPISSAHLQALAAIGRSDMRLKLEFIKKPLGLILLFLAIDHGPFAIAVSATLASVIGALVDVAGSSLYVKLSIKEQIKEFIPVALITAVMGVIVYVVGLLALPYLLLMVLQILVGVVSYVILSMLIKPTGYRYLKNLVMSVLKRKMKGASHG